MESFGVVTMQAAALRPIIAASVRESTPCSPARGGFVVPSGKETAAWKGFVTGSLAAICAGAVTHPIDLIKVRMQLAGSLDGNLATKSAAEHVARVGLVSTATNVIKNEGILGLYSGISGNMLRQSTLIGARLGFYAEIKKRFMDDAGQVTFAGKVMSGMGAGALGAIVGNPADLVMVRMQADGRLPPDQRRNYKHAFDALRRIRMEEGGRALWRGVLPTMNRAMIVTAAQMACYDTSKEWFINNAGFSDNIFTHTCAALVAGGAAGISSNPFDVAKTRLQNMERLPNGRFPYKGTFHCIMTTASKEGPAALYKGLTATWLRQAPLNIVRFVALEQLRKIFAKF